MRCEIRLTLRALLFHLLRPLGFNLFFLFFDRRIRWVLVGFNLIPFVSLSFFVSDTYISISVSGSLRVLH